MLKQYIIILIFIFLNSQVCACLEAGQKIRIYRSEALNTIIATLYHGSDLEIMTSLYKSLRTGEIKTESALLVLEQRGVIVWRKRKPIPTSVEGSAILEQAVLDFEVSEDLKKITR